VLHLSNFVTFMSYFPIFDSFCSNLQKAANVEEAFIKTAEKIYDNIQSGVYDVTNEVRNSFATSCE
jgi:hypothetical protein